MASAGPARRWAATLALALLLAAPTARAGWPAALPAQPLAQAPLRCAPGIVPLNRRCRVVDYADLGTVADHHWYYAFYATHWADRHGRHDRGFPIVFFLQPPATLRLSLWIDDAPGLAGHWATTPPPRPVIIQSGGAVFLGFTLEGLKAADDQRLFRLVRLHWKGVDIMTRSDADQAKLDAATPTGCAPTPDWRFDWPTFTLRMPLRRDLTGADCGEIVAEAQVRRDVLSLADARLER